MPLVAAGFEPAKRALTLELLQTLLTLTPLALLGALWAAVLQAARGLAELSAAPAFVPQIDFRKRRLIPPRKSGFGPALLFQLRQYELDVLAGAQFIGRVIRAGAKIIPRPQTANRHTLTRYRTPPSAGAR